MKNPNNSLQQMLFTVHITKLNKYRSILGILIINFIDFLYFIFNKLYVF